MRVLLVDDNATNRLVLSRMFENWGMQVTALATGADALSSIDRVVPQLIVPRCTDAGNGRFHAGGPSAG